MSERHILVVEDNPTLLMGIQSILEVEGYSVVTATNGVHALQVLEQVQPDLIVADTMMPKMDGYAFYRAVRERPEWTQSPLSF